MEKGIRTYEFTIGDDGTIQDHDVSFNLVYNDPMNSMGEPVLFAHYIDTDGDKVYFEEVDYNYNDHIVTIGNYDSELHIRLSSSTPIVVEFMADLHNKYRLFNDFNINLETNDIELLGWDMTTNPDDNLMANYESESYIYDEQKGSMMAKGKVKQIYATIDDANDLIYYLDGTLDDTEGWKDYKTLVMKLGLLNPYPLDYLNVEFHFVNASGDQLIGSAQVTLDMFDDEAGSVYIPLPEAEDFDQFKVSNNAYIKFTPIFYESEDFEGYFYEQGLPTIQEVIWDTDKVMDNVLNITLEQDPFFADQQVYVLNELFEYIYALNTSSFVQEFTNNYNPNDGYDLTLYNVSLPLYYNDSNNNLIDMRNNEFLYLKYNATLEKSIGLTVGEMSLLRDNYLSNHIEGEPDVPVAEVALLGINVVEDQFRYNDTSDLYRNRTELVAWEYELEVTPFKDSFKDTYRQMVFNISFDDIANDFIIEDETGTEHCYVTDILITSNDPSYELIVDSFFIFEFDYNATMYNSELFDLYPYNHMEEFYFDYVDIYDEFIIFNCSEEYLPLYYFDSNINETDYFEAYGSRDNYYYMGEHLTVSNISESGVDEGVYNITWNPMYSEEFYYDLKHADNCQHFDDIMESYEYYNPYISNYSYLYLSWADENSVYEWRTIDQPNIITDTIEVAYDYYDEATEEFTTVYYNQSKYEFEVRQIAIEYFYPYNITQDTYEFALSQNYSNAINLDVASAEGYYFDESNLTLNAQILGDDMTLEITAPTGDLSQFQFIMVIISFNKGAYSDYTQIKLTEAALNYPESQSWSINDSLWIDYEYNDLDYFLLFEDYDVGSDESWFEYIEYIRNEEFVQHDDVYDSFEMIMGTQEYDFEAFTEANDESHVIEFHDYNMDAQHELVIEKEDLLGDGKYDSFKYGQVNDGGEIMFHTLIQAATYETQSIRKLEQEKENPEAFQLDSLNYIDKLLTPNYGGWDDIGEEFWNTYDISAKKEIKSETTISTHIKKKFLLIQQDFDMDGFPDKEMTYEISTSSLTATTHIRDKTTIYFESEQNYFAQSREEMEIVTKEEYIKQYSTSIYRESTTEFSVIFRDFEQDEVTNSRFYKDIFPNELTEKYDLSNYLITASNDMGDHDPYNDVQLDVVDNSPLASLVHINDNVPAMFDSLREYYDGEITTENILSTLETLNVP